MDFHYKEQIVAFIDILGFSELVKRSTTDPGSFEKVSKIITFVRNITLEQEEIFRGDPFYLHISFISDSVVISVDAPSSVTAPQFWNILKFVGGIGLNLLAIDAPCRGAIVNDQLFHHRESNFNTVVGPALVKANKIEKKCAKNPRIVVDKSVLPFWEDWLKTEAGFDQDSWRDVLKQDQDGKWFINIFHSLFFGVVSHLFCYRDYQDYNIILKEAGDSIIKGLEEPEPEPGVRDKYNWLLSQYLPYASTDFKKKNCLDVVST